MERQPFINLANVWQQQHAKDVSGRVNRPDAVRDIAFEARY